jgi:hypothetical protein
MLVTTGKLRAHHIYKKATFFTTSASYTQANSKPATVPSISVNSFSNSREMSP